MRAVTRGFRVKARSDWNIVSCALGVKWGVSLSKLGNLVDSDI